MISIFSHTAAEFAEAHTILHGKGKLHALQLYRQFMKKGIWEESDPMFKNAGHLFEKISNSTDRELLSVSSLLEEGDTVKLILSTPDGFLIESVVIPMQHGKTLCVSSQVGCRMGCTFCETGRMGLLRNLEPSEIVRQVYHAHIHLGHAINNIVFMGMGEPFDNYDSVMKAIDILTDQNGLAFGMGNITVSTSGKLEAVYRLAEDQARGINLAISLNAVQSDLRSKLMPHNRKEGLDAIYKAIFNYNQKKNREVLVGYVLMKGINDSLEHAQSLVEFLQGLRIKVNLIPYNPQRNDRFKRPEEIAIERFSNHLQAAGLKVLYRKTKGTSIMAACGQLGGKKQPSDLSKEN